MQLYPAIDIKNGQCVRLIQGLFDHANVYSDSPVDVAKKWMEQGATYIHLVDLDGAVAGHSVNAKAIKEIAYAIPIPLQLGGGIRSIQDIEYVLNCGIYRVIIGTRAVESPAFVKEAITIFGAEKIVVGVDIKDGRVATNGWEKVSQYPALEFCLKMQELGVKTVIFTDVQRDGMLQGPNVELTAEISNQTKLNVIASGGVSTLMDLEKIKDAGIHGAIIGKALYENRIHLKEAIQMFQQGQ